MTEDIKEMLKAVHYGYSIEAVADIFDLDIEEAKKIVAENIDFLDELGERDYGNL